MGIEKELRRSLRVLKVIREVRRVKAGVLFRLQVVTFGGLETSNVDQGGVRVALHA